jgi:integrase
MGVSMLLSDIYQNAYAKQNLKIRSESTRKHYRIMFKHLAEYLGHQPTIDDLNDEHAAGFAHWLIARGLAAATVNQRLHYMRALWTWLAKRGIVSKFPTIIKLPEPARVPRGWSEKQIAQLFGACRRMQGMIAGVPAGDWWYGLHLFWWDTGERTMASLSIEWDWLDLETGVLDVPPEVRKGKHKGMLYTLKAPTLEVLRKIKQPKRRLIFPWPYHPGTFYNHYDRLLESAGLPTDRRSKPQKMRRSFASHIEAHGGNATEALDHTARSVTVRSYLDQSIVNRRPANLVLPIIQPEIERA